MYFPFCLICFVYQGHHSYLWIMSQDVITPFFSGLSMHFPSYHYSFRLYYVCTFINVLCEWMDVGLGSAEEGRSLPFHLCLWRLMAAFGGGRWERPLLHAKALLTAHPHIIPLERHWEEARGGRGMEVRRDLKWFKVEDESEEESSVQRWGVGNGHERKQIGKLLRSLKNRFILFTLMYHVSLCHRRLVISQSAELLLLLLLDWHNFYYFICTLKPSYLYVMNRGLKCRLFNSL